jgi:hypothetical protein
MACFWRRRFGACSRFSLIASLSYHSIQPRSSSPSTRRTTTGVRACICFR